MYQHFEGSLLNEPRLQSPSDSFEFEEYMEYGYSPVELYPADIKRSIKSLPLGKQGYVVIGGANLVLRGIKPTTSDIDMLVSRKTYQTLLQLQNAIEVSPPYDAVRNGATNMTLHIEVERNMLVSAYTYLSGNGYYPLSFDTINETAEVIDGVRVAALGEVIASKQALAREKDLIDLGKIAAKTGVAIQIPPLRDKITETY